MMKSQRSDTEKNNLIEEVKIICIDKIIKLNEIIIKNLKSQVYNNAIILFKVQKIQRA